MAEQRYQILESLGAGGSGTVFLALDAVLQRRVAIKRLLTVDGAARTDDEITAIKREAATMAQLRHENIVTTYDIAEDTEGLFIVMELVEGQDLEAWLRFQPLAWNDFVQVVTQTLDAMLAAHRLRVLHLDLKPGNIRIQRLPDVRLKTTILDFGLAQLAMAPEKQRLSVDGRLFGSVYYMAPEQFRLEEIDTRTDLYALGCIYYECLTGKMPFQGSTSVAVRDAHLAHELIPLQQKRPDLPAPLCHWIMWLLQADRAQRPNDAAVALHAFQALCYQVAAWSGHMVMPVSQSPGPQPEATVPIPPAKAPAPRPVTQPHKPLSKPVRPATTAVKAPAAKPVAAAPAQSTRPRPGGAVVSIASLVKALPLPVRIGAVSLILVIGAVLLFTGRGGPVEERQDPPGTGGKTVAAGQEATKTRLPPKPAALGVRPFAAARSDVAAVVLPRADHVVARFLASDQVLTFNNPSSPRIDEATIPALVGQPVAAWVDVMPEDGHLQLTQSGLIVKSAPKFNQVSAPGLRGTLPALSFDGSQSVSLMRWNWQPQQGMTVTMVLLLRDTARQMRRMTLLGFLGGGKNTPSLSASAQEENQKPVIRVGGTMGGGAAYWSTKADRPNGAVPLIFAAALDLQGHEARLELRCPNNWRQTSSAPVEIGTPSAYTTLRIGPGLKPDGTGFANLDGLHADLFEVVIHDIPLSSSEMETLVGKLAGRYFTP